MYSFDLSAAFDLLRRDKFDDVVGHLMSDGLRHAVLDFLSERSMIVEVAKARSRQKSLDVGCVQGSTLGPKLFTLYTSRIGSSLEADKYVCYADDSYVLISESDLSVAHERVKAISKHHAEELRALGMVVNEAKSEIVVFSRKGQSIMEFDIAGATVSSKASMKVLGTIFDCNLSWEAHIRQNVQTSTWKLSVLRRIRKSFTKEQFLRILTAQYFSKLYYCAPVWLTSNTKKSLWALITRAHYKAVRIAACDYRSRINREKLDILCSRAPPKQWSKYSTATLVMKIVRDKRPITLFASLSETIYIERRNEFRAKFYDNSKGKIGRQRFGNSLQFMHAIGDDWFGKQLSNDAIRILLKRTYFYYITNQKLVTL
jgi:hypothetical protein